MSQARDNSRPESNDASSVIFQPLAPDQAKSQSPVIPRLLQALVRARWLDIVFVLAIVSIYAGGVLKFGIENRLPGNETEVFTAVGWYLHTSLIENHQLPLWNPYIHTGLPYLGDPMLYIYNPIASLPVILWGGWDGFKVGVFLSFIIAASGMLWLGKVLGLGRVATLWAGLIYTFGGQPVARFFQGEYLFIFGFAWIPWIVAALYRVIQSERRRYVVLLALFMALLYFSGNAYYPFLMLFVIAFFCASHLISIKRIRPFIRFDSAKARRLVAAGALALGIIAVQLLPNIEFWPHMSKGLGAYGAQSARQIYLDYTSKDTFRADAYQELPAREEFYAYIGTAPFMVLVLLPLVDRKQYSRTILFLLLVVGFVISYINLRAMPWHDIYEKTRYLSQFRHLLRPLLFGSFAILLLGALGIDALWKLIPQEIQPGKNDRRLQIKDRLPAIARVLLILFTLAAVWDVFVTNKDYIRTEAMQTSPINAANWLKKYDENVYYTRFNPNNAGFYGLLSNHLRFIDAWYHWNDIRDLNGNISQRIVQARPKYVVQAAGDSYPEGTGVQLIQEVEGYNVFYLPDSLPFAFMVETAQLATDGPELTLPMVDEVMALPTEPGKIEIIASSEEGQILVVLNTLYHGWRASIDGNDQPIQNVGGYMAVAAQPGVHKYTFQYIPRLFFIGLAISLLSTVIGLWLYFSDVRLDRQALKEQWRDFAGKVRELRWRWPRGQKRLPPEPFEVVYREGSLVPSQDLGLEENARVRVTVEAAPARSPAQAAWQRWVWASGDLARALRRAIPLEMALFTIALVFYLTTRLVGLADFPIYFFTDEAVQTVMAEDFIQDGLRNYDGEVLPTYFSKGSSYNLSSVSVYLQVIPYLLFGKSIFVTRVISVLITSLGALAVGLILRDIFKLRYWWVGVLLLSVAPAWFLHSRTAFETAEMASFYAGFLYFYLRYRCISPKALYPALVMGALVFYTYSPGQLIIVVTGLLLLILDLRYHWQNRHIALRGLLLLGVLALPYLRYLLAHPEALGQHLSTRAPYWAQNIPLLEKLGRYFTEYAYAFSPAYWFIPNQHDLERHLMSGYGHLLLVTLPLLALGLVMILVKLKSPPHRIILAALLAAPSGAALVGIGITRVLVFIIPAVIIMALGLVQVLGWIEDGLGWLFRYKWTPKRRASLYPILSVVLLLVFVAGGMAMLGDALANGPTWYQDYTLAGMQYGASQLFGAVEEYLRQNPGTELIVSPSWTNGADAVAEFFLPPELPVKLGSIEGHLYQKLPLDDSMTFVMIPVEMEKAVDSGKFKDIQVEQVLPYPNGEPGFYFARLQYTDDIDAILAAEQELRSALNQTTLTLQDEAVEVEYSMLDMGSIELVFDGDVNTVARTLEANPFIIVLTFAEVRQLNGYRMFLGSADAQVTVLLDPGEGGEPLESVANFDGSVSQPILEVSFGGVVAAQVVRFEILQPYSGVPANVHVWEIELK